MTNDPKSDRQLQAARLAPLLRSQAANDVYWGMSSWKYDGWLGSIYSPTPCETRGKFSKKKFEETCLAEYAETFPTVCGDFDYYQFPSADYWQRLFEGTPSTLLSSAFKLSSMAHIRGRPRLGTSSRRVVGR